MKRLAALAVCAVMATPAFANPEFMADPEPQSPDALRAEIAELSERLAELSAQLDAQTDRRADRERGLFSSERDGDVTVHRIIGDPDELREAARGIEAAIEEADIFETMAELMIAFSEDVAVIEGEDSLALRFKDRDLATVETDDRDGVKIRAGGRTITVETD